MSSTPNTSIDTPSPKPNLPIIAPQNERQKIPDLQPEEAGPTPGPVRRPSFEKLDPAEVATALNVANMLKSMKPTQQKPKQEKPKKPTIQPPASFMPRPPPVPFSDNSNPDAVTLRATTELLQMQKARSTHDIQTLDQLKELNRKDPVEFLRQLTAGKLKPEAGVEGVLGATISPELIKMLSAVDLIATEQAKQASADGEKMQLDGENEEGTEYPRFPAPQQIIRTPAINWSKYGILGDSLDKMHEEQRTYPSLGEPERLATRDSQPATPIVEQHQYTEDKAEKYVMAAPYDPLKDQVAGVKRGSKKSY